MIYFLKLRLWNYTKTLINEIYIFILFLIIAISKAIN